MSLDGLPAAEQALLLLFYSVLALLALSVLFGALTVLLRARSQRDARFREIREARWDPVILDLLDGTSDPSDLLDLVQPHEGLDFLGYLLTYYRRIRGDSAARLQQLARPLLPLVLDRVGRGRVERRALAVQTLGLLGMPEYAGVVQDALDDPSPLVSMIAAKALAAHGQPEAARLFLERIDRYADLHPSLLVGVLSDAGAEAPLLRRTLGTASQPAWVRAVVARALADLNDPESADVAAAILDPGAPIDLLVGCLRILAEVGEHRHRDRVIPLLESPTFAVRAGALEALRTVGSVADLPRFSDALDDESPWVALQAALGLRALGALEPLRELAASGSPRSSTAREVLFE